MTMQPYGPERNSGDDPTQDLTPSAHPTDELPTYRKVAGYPETDPVPGPTRPSASSGGWTGGTGQLPVAGAPVATPPPVIRPRGPHLPTVIRGLFVLVLATFAFVWRLVDDPNWPVVGITVGIAAGALLLLAAGISALLHSARADSDFDRVLTGR